MQNSAKLVILIISAFILLYRHSIPANAQISSSGIAIPIPISQDVVDGDIVCTTPEGLIRCVENYDPAMFGVFSENPSAEIKDNELTDAKPVITSGITEVRVSLENGPILEGSFVTSSTIPGVGVLADRNGFVLGSAIEAYNSTDPEDIGKIAVIVNVHPAAGITSSGNNLIQFIREGIAVPVVGPLESLRYLLAVLIVLISFVLGLFYFGRVSRSGVEAIGRNPLAHRVIQLTIVLHVLLSIVIILVGLGIAYLILIL